MSNFEMTEENKWRFRCNTLRIFGCEVNDTFGYGFGSVHEFESLERMESYFFGVFCECLSVVFNLTEITSTHQKVAVGAIFNPGDFRSGYEVCLLRLKQDVNSEILLSRLLASSQNLPGYYEEGRSNASWHLENNSEDSGFVGVSSELPKIGNFERMIRFESVKTSPLKRYLGEDLGEERKGLLTNLLSRFR